MSETEGYSTLIVERSEGIVRVILNRPEKKNAINMAMWADLDHVLREVSSNNRDRVVILSGANGSFSSGADLSSSIVSPHPLQNIRWINSVGLSLHGLNKPTIAAVDGIALGAGCNLALMCDLIIASDRSEFGEIFVRRGLSVDLGGSWILPRLIGLQQAKALCLTGDIISAQRAKELGLILKAVPESEFSGEILTMARRLACGPPVAQEITKRLLDAGSSSTIEEAFEAEALAQVVNVASHDSAEAKVAFFEGREPVFNGGWNQARSSVAAEKKRTP